MNSRCKGMRDQAIREKTIGRDQVVRKIIGSVLMGWLVVAGIGWTADSQAGGSNLASVAVADKGSPSPVVKALVEETEQTIAVLEAFKKQIQEGESGLDINRLSYHGYRRPMEELRRILAQALKETSMPRLQAGGPTGGRRRMRPVPPLAPLGFSDDDWGFDLDMGFDSFFHDFQRMRDDMDRLMSRALGHWAPLGGWAAGRDNMGFMPSVDIQDAGDRYIVRMDVPGMDKADFNLEVKDQILAVSGSLREDQEDSRQGYVRRERRFGQFQRSILLPGPVDADKTEATYNSGVLEVTLPKAGHAPAKKKVPVL